MDARVTELHCIMPIANVVSVMQHGILSYDSASKLNHHSVALQAVQDRRDQKQVPGGLKLHQYANLYFHARNPMLSRRRREAESLCVLRISTQVFEIQGVVITDQNASSDYVRFLDPSQWKLLSFDDIYAADWRHPDDQIAYWRHKARKCAEVLVPNLVESKFVIGAYVLDVSAQTRLTNTGFASGITSDRDLFFR
jgi:ssDNA thymidine ADP-ribosyltransferase, DarT